MVECWRQFGRPAVESMPFITAPTIERQGATVGKPRIGLAHHAKEQYPEIEFSNRSWWVTPIRTCASPKPQAWLESLSDRSSGAHYGRSHRAVAFRFRRHARLNLFNPHAVRGMPQGILACVTEPSPSSCPAPGILVDIGEGTGGTRRRRIEAHAWQHSCSSPHHRETAVDRRILSDAIGRTRHDVKG